MKANLLLGAAITLFGAYFLMQAAGLSARARLFPQMVLWGIVATGVLLMIDALRQALRADGQSRDEALGLLGQVALPGALLVLAYGLLATLGFYLTIPALLLAIYLLHRHRAHPGSLGAATLVAGIGFAAAATATMFVLFSLLLGLPAPSGAVF